MKSKEFFWQSDHLTFQWAEEISKSGEDFDNILNNPQYAYGPAPAVYTYLVDTFPINGGLQVKALPEFLLGSGNFLYQEKNITTKGGIYELALGFASNKKDKLSQEVDKDLHIEELKKMA